jgi:hypothetical protein
MPVNDENVRLFFGLGKFSGKFYIDNISLTQIQDSSTGNNESALNNADILIYPNPSAGVFTVQLSSKDNLNKQILELYSFDGKLLYQTQLLNVKTKINLDHLKQGIYIVKVTSDIKYTTKKLVIN